MQGGILLCLFLFSFLFSFLFFSLFSRLIACFSFVPFIKLGLALTATLGYAVRPTHQSGRIQAS